MGLIIGKKYKVYEDPLTKTKLEGIATVILIEDIGSWLEDGYYFCYVKFEGGFGEPDVIRKVCEHDILEV